MLSVVILTVFKSAAVVSAMGFRVEFYSPMSKTRIWDSAIVAVREDVKPIERALKGAISSRRMGDGPVDGRRMRTAFVLDGTVWYIDAEGNFDNGAYAGRLSPTAMAQIESKFHGIYRQARKPMLPEDYMVPTKP